MRLTYQSARPIASGWRYLWGKTVRGFNPAVHCARCLVGDYLAEVSPSMPANAPIELAFPEGTIVYICGVSTPYRWANNLHLAVRVRAGRQTYAQTYNGDALEIEGAEPVPFDDRRARALYPGRSAAFLTCRNFQFGAHVYGE